MFVKYNSYAPNPSLRGTIADPKPHIAEALVAQGIADYYRYPTLREHMEAVEKSRAARESATAPKPAVQWAMKKSERRDVLQYVVSRTDVCGTTHYDAPPKDAPQWLKDKFKAMVATDAQLFKDRQEVLKQQANEPAFNGYQGALARVTVIGANGVKQHDR